MPLFFSLIVSRPNKLKDLAVAESIVVSQWQFAPDLSFFPQKDSGFILS